jgi:hypothetical protein
MTSHEEPGFLRRLLASLGRALRGESPGRPSQDDTKQLTESCAYWDRVIAAPFAGAPEQPSPRVGDKARGPSEPEFEPVHAWTRRQLEDYLRRNPGYRPAYEAELHLRCHVRSVPSAGTADGYRRVAAGEIEAAPVRAARRQKEAQPPGSVRQPSTDREEALKR